MAGGYIQLELLPPGKDEDAYLQISPDHPYLAKTEPAEMSEAEGEFPIEEVNNPIGVEPLQPSSRTSSKYTNPYDKGPQAQAPSPEEVRDHYELDVQT